MATLGGKYLIERPIQVADDGIVSIGDAATVVWGLKSIGIGSSINSPMGDEQCVLVGSDLTLRGNTVVADVLMGRTLWVGQQSSSCVLIGDISSIDHNSDIAIAIGREATIGDNSPGSIVMGYQTRVVGQGGFNNVIGQVSGCETAGIQYASLFGTGNHVVSDGTGGTGKILLFGVGNVAGSPTTNTQSVLAMGDNNVVGEDASTSGSTYVQVIGTGNYVGGSSTTVSCMGSGNRIGPSTVSILAAGDNIGVGQGVLSSILLGSHLDITGPFPSTPTMDSIVNIGFRNALAGPYLGALVVEGSDNSVTGENFSTILGQNNTVHGGGAGYNVVIGDHNVVDSTSMSVIIGRGIHILDGNQSTVGAVIAIGPAVSVAANYGGLGGIAIGGGANLISTGGYAIALGFNASAGNNTCVIGHSDPASETGAMHLFIVRGLNVSVGPHVAIDTFIASDHPGSGQTGLTVVYNSSGTFSSKIINAAVTPPGGSLLLYLNP